MFKSSHIDIQPQIENFFLQNYGWQFSLDTHYADAKIAEVCKKMGFHDVRECFNSLSESESPKALLQTVAKEFSIGESYFLRDKNFFHALEHRVIPQFLKEKSLYDKNINIWSVGCSSGEEVYSVSIMLHQHIPDISSWNIHILGTDINVDVLEKAKNGIYTEYSFRDTPHSYKHFYFNKIDDTYEVQERYKKNVQFVEHNIIHKTNPLSYQNTFFDLIILKNVLIYFNPHKGKEVVDYLFTNLHPNGWLSTTPVEYASDIFSAYRGMSFSSEGLIQKSAMVKMPSEIFGEISYQPENNFEPLKMIHSYKQSVEDKIVLNDTPYAHYKKSCEMLEVAKIQEAKKHLRKSLYLDNRFIVGLISLGNIYKKEKNLEKYTLYINRAKNLLFEMHPSEIVECSDNMTADELIAMIDYENIQDKGFLNANIERNS
jgi:chemotaxis protein methyltransferase CheR